jgi:hypothetical protein
MPLLLAAQSESRRKTKVTPYNKAIVAGIFAAATAAEAVSAGVGFTATGWIIIGTAALGPLSALLVPNVAPAPAALPVVPTQTPGVPLTPPADKTYQYRPPST